VAGSKCTTKTGGRAGYHGPRRLRAATGDHVPRNEESTGIRAWGQDMQRLYLLLPKDLMEQIPAEKHKKNAYIRDALRLALGGDALRWKRRYEHEREQRLLLERKLQLIRETAA
jgi:hypothetical protein